MSGTWNAPGTLDVLARVVGVCVCTQRYKQQEVGRLDETTDLLLFSMPDPEGSPR